MKAADHKNLPHKFKKRRGNTTGTPPTPSETDSTNDSSFIMNPSASSPSTTTQTAVKKIVTFSSVARMRLVTSRLTASTTTGSSSCTESCSNDDLWYSKREQMQRAKKDISIISLMNLQYEQEPVSCVVVKSNRSGKHLCTRGLEDKTNVGLQRKMERRIASWETVLQCQSLGVDPTVIASVLATISKPARDYAIQIARQDELVNVLYDDDNCNSSSNDDISIASIDETEHVLQVEEEQKVDDEAQSEPIQPTPTGRLYNKDMLKYSPSTPTMQERKKLRRSSIPEHHHHQPIHHCHSSDNRTRRMSS